LSVSVPDYQTHFFLERGEISHLQING